MKLGIFVLNPNQLSAILGLTTAALEAGDSVRFFINDHGTKLLAEPSFTALADRVAMSFCEYSAKKLGVDLSNLPKAIKKGTQLNNAIMYQSCEKVIVL
ncbi:MAG: hypothetical protein QNL04_07765 [SAR324 cluster bacterium]|nr:hypothetical protein [SAR324 cluster bacterium]